SQTMCTPSLPKLDKSEYSFHIDTYVFITRLVDFFDHNKPVVQENKTEAAPHIGKSSSNTIGLATLFTLAILSAVAPFSIDLYLPAFPAMTEDLHTTATGVQLSLTAFLIGAGVGQVVFGPLSDRIGRLIPLYIGLVLFLVASIVTVFACNVEILVAARLAQGLGGASGMVIG